MYPWCFMIICGLTRYGKRLRLSAHNLHPICAVVSFPHSPNHHEISINHVYQSVVSHQAARVFISPRISPASALIQTQKHLVHHESCTLL